MQTPTLNRGWRPPGHAADWSPEDPTGAMIAGSGYIDSPYLWRRWVTAQITRNGQNGPSGFEERFFRNKPYAYEWSTALNEISAMSHMHGHDLDRRARFLNAGTVTSMLRHYAVSLKGYVAALPHVSANGHACVVLPDGRLIRTDTDAFPSLDDTLSETDLAIRLSRTDKCRRSFLELKKVISRFRRHAILDVPLEKSDAWKNAFYGIGAFYALDGMIKFQNCRIRDENGGLLPLDGSLAALDAMSEKYRMERNGNHAFFLAMLDIAAYNGIGTVAGQPEPSS